MTTIGVKGSDVYTTDAFQTFGEKMVALSALLTRGVSEATVQAAVSEVFTMPSHDHNSVIEELLVLAFQTRDVRGGKGERDASKYIFEYLLMEPKTKEVTLDLLDLFAEYGCWQDLFKMANHETYPRIKQIVKEQFAKDEAAIYAYKWAAQASEVAGWGGEEKAKKPKVSLLAKWLPREGQPGVIEMVCTLVPGTMFHGTRMKLYRKKVAAVNKFLQTVEVKMCAGDWEEIEPGTVPGRAVKKYVKAFLNEKGTTT